MKLLVFFSPTTHSDLIKQALFSVGAGQMGHYSHCAWQVQGQGEFQAEAKADPFIGHKDQSTQVLEHRIEMILSDDQQEIVRNTLLAIHPYETPAYYFIEIAP